jgi:hypothetical protein
MTKEVNMRPALRWRDGIPTIVRPIVTLLVTLTLAGLSAGSASAAAGPEGAELIFNIDPEVEPAQRTLPPASGRDPERPLASLVDRHGNHAEFVANELVLVTDEAAALEQFVARWDGEVLVNLDPATYGVPGLPPRYLVRIDPRRADVDQLAADLSEANPHARGPHRVSSKEGLALLAAAASETTSDLEIGMNWVATFGDVAQGTSMEGVVPPSTMSRNAFAWPHLCNAGTVPGGGPCPQDTGVSEAWRLLDRRGFFANATVNGRVRTTGVPASERIGVAILDGGFAPSPPFDADLHPDLVQFTAGRNPGFCTGGASCPWHGTNVTSTAMSTPDNDFGAAGPGGLVAKPIQMGLLGDAFGALQALLDAHSRGIKIANMSWGVPVPASVSGFAQFGDPLLAELRDRGMMLVAGAGNEGRPVDMVDCFLACWEAAYFWPCEGPKVFCVGALAAQSKTPFFTNPSFGSSNFRGPASNQSPGETVDFWAPGNVLVGPDPDVPMTQDFGGTSAASPFIAGVAAMVLAADPSLSADGIEDLLSTTAQPTDPHPQTGASELMVDAHAAVRRALAPVADAGPDQSVDEGAQFSLDGGGSNDADGRALSHRWTQMGGPPATPSAASVAAPTFTAPNVSATSTVTFELVVSNGSRSSQPDRVTVTVRDVRSSATKPVVTVPADILHRTWSSEGDIVTFSTSAWDAEDGPLPVTCSPSSGSFFPLGTHTVTCHATDTAGDTGWASFNVTVDPHEDPPK